MASGRLLAIEICEYLSTSLPGSPTENKDHRNLYIYFRWCSDGAEKDTIIFCTYYLINLLREYDSVEGGRKEP